MPRKKAQQPAPVVATAVEEAAPKKWADAELLKTPAKIAFQFSEDRIDNVLVFKFADDPGQPIKDQLVHYGYRYQPDQRNWIVNATPVTREIARRLTTEFSTASEIAR